MLQEYKLKNKSNLFLDKRIGEKDNNLSAEDRMIARFTAERIKGSGKTSIFNLGEDISLTHGGEKLTDIDKFDDPNSDEDEEEDNLLNKDFVNEAHFGGFMTKADDDFKAGKGNSRKDYIENLIRESKLKKAEKRKAEEAAEEKTTELDMNWRNMLKNIQEGNPLLKWKKDLEEPTSNYDPYDMLVKSLSFQKKEARAGERLKTDEEKIKDERERLQKLEDDRLRRMRGETESSVKHSSVEDLDGGNGGEKKITRKERRALEKAEKRRLKTGDSGDEDDNESEGEETGEKSDSDEDGNDESENEGESDEDAEDDNGDLDESDEEDEENKDLPEFNIEDYNEKDSFDKNVVEMMDKASKEIPYIIKVHDSYESFSALVWDRSSEELQTILDRILSTNHPQVSEDKLLLVPHYQHMIQYIQDLSQNYQSDLINVAVTHLAKLTGLFQQAAATCLLQVVVDKQAEFSEAARPRYPSLDTVILLHLLHLLFPSSDYRHPVITPAVTFICQILSSARPMDRASFSSCISLCSIMLEYVTMSKRLVPELLNTLQGLLYVASSNNITRPLPPCKGGVHLTISKKVKTQQTENLHFSEVNSVKDIDDQFKVTAISATLKIIIKLLKLYREIPSALELFQPMLSPLENIKLENYPETVRDKISQIKESIKSLKRKKAPVLKPSKKTPMLRMMEPKIEDDFDPFVKKRVGKKDLLEQQKMRHKLKQEKKGARKEIRQDTAFLASQRMKEQRLKDEDRQTKTKALFGNLASQEGDYKKLLKKKKKF